jgi:type I restriction enzyme S subunit
MGKWERKTLKDADVRVLKGEGLTSDKMLPGEIPVIAGGLSYCGMHNRANRNENCITVSASGANAGAVLFHRSKIFATDCSSIEWGGSQEFLYYALARRQKEFTSMQSGLAQPHVYPRDIEKFMLFYPTDTKEQHNIAAVLTSTDEAIAASRALVKKFTVVKQGLMQDLFGMRERVRLDSGIVEINPYCREKRPDLFYYIDLEAVIAGEITKDVIVSRNEAPSRAQRLLKPNDILFQTVRPYQQNNYLFRKERELKTVASTGYAQIRTDNNAVYMYYALHQNEFVREVNNRSTGSSYPAINPTELGKCSIRFEADRAIQDEIAQILTAADERLTAERERLRKLEDIKRGLMDDLLTNSVSADLLQGGN